MTRNLPVEALNLQHEIQKKLKPATNELATLEFGYKTFNTIHRNLENLLQKYY